MKKVALVTPNFAESGGTASMTKFLYRSLHKKEHYNPQIISLASSSDDEASFQISDPKTWNGPRVISRSKEEIDHKHVGTWLSELEPFRYKHRKVLDDVLSGFDIIQFVVGKPPWARVACNVDVPTFLWTATTLWEDRKARLNTENGPRSLLRRAVTWWACSYEREALGMVDGVLALSEYTRRRLKNEFSIDAEVAPYGIDAEKFRPVSDPEESYILSVSRINDPRKQTPLLIEAHARAKDASKRVPNLYLVGDEPNRKIRQVVKNNGLSEDVNFLGWKSQNELVKLYQDALCFVLSSAEEGLGIVVLEAMACGRPVISTRCGGPETLIVDRETGFLTPSSDAKSLAEKIIKLSEESVLRGQMGRAARNRVENRFRSEIVEKKFVSAYKR